MTNTLTGFEIEITKFDDEGGEYLIASNAVFDEE